MRHFIAGENVGLLTCRQSAVNSWEHVSITKYMIDFCRVSNRTKESGYVMPLYLYPEQDEFLSDGRIPNLDPEIVDRIAEKIKLAFVPEEGAVVDPAAGFEGCFAPIDLFDYIYAVLHSPAYRRKYREFLKTDFPRVPYPADAGQFRRLAAIGSKLRRLHLLEDQEEWGMAVVYPQSGTDEVADVRYSDGKVYINETQYFEGVSPTVWNFYIGGYQPAQKWLKDRKGHRLTFDDICRYRAVVAALDGTERLMEEIDTDGWPV